MVFSVIELQFALNLNLSADYPAICLPLHRTESADEPELLSTDMRRELQRQKWEQEQEEMLSEQPTVHYANVQYDGKSQYNLCLIYIRIISI